MLQLTRKTDYALVALSDLARRKANESGPTSARLIAEAYKLPLPLLMNILKELAQAKLVTSTRGATGGYELAVEPGRVSLLEVINAIEGPVKLAPCCDGLPIVGQGCGMEDCCPIQTSINKLHQRMIKFFDGVMLDELIDDLTHAQASAPQACSTHGHVVASNGATAKLK
ncbi:MAG: Rrf2 family transcriptional regulator [Planctomycetota bacterium]